ncbi:MAG: ribose 5-phosphate isomerase B [candidate division Zixibacteria bacterium]|nr:ribose 5-phosphate isomerase B [candidate division Zixibacteria bacterium]
MKISLGADHRGFKYKELIKKLLTAKGISFEDFGTLSEDSADFSDYGIKAAEAVAKKDVDYGIVICGTGNGMAMAANKVKGVRAGLASNVDMARLTRAHNDANVLVLSEMFTPEKQLADIINVFLNTEFEGGRHARRIGKIIDYEQG